MITAGQYQLVLRLQGERAANEFAAANGDVWATGIDENGLERFLTPEEAHAFVGVWNPATWEPIDLSIARLPLPVATTQTVVPTPTVQPAENPDTFYSDTPDVNVIESYDPDATIGGSLTALPVAVATLRSVATLLRGFLGSATRVTSAAWNRLTPTQQTIAATGGIVIGTELALDLAGIDDTGIIPNFGFPDGSPAQLPNAVIVGQWTANGVRFYRLSDGKIAVQRKNGTWKVWRPKKPIVLYAGGASNLKTFLRADSALDKQAKRLKKALNRRAPTRKRSTPHDHGDGTSVVNVK